MSSVHKCARPSDAATSGSGTSMFRRNGSAWTVKLIMRARAAVQGSREYAGVAPSGSHQVIGAPSCDGCTSRIATLQSLRGVHGHALDRAVGDGHHLDVAVQLLNAGLFQNPVATH